MAGSNISKVEARRRVREAQARANEARAQRERANVDDAATLVVAVGKVGEVDAWETARLAQARDQVRAEANRKRVYHRTEAAAAIARMQQRGETLATIAELTPPASARSARCCGMRRRLKITLRVRLRVH
jgi:hypothetical protein